MYYLNQKCSACTIPKIDFISINIFYTCCVLQLILSLFIIYSFIFIPLLLRIKNAVSASIFWESHFLINCISSMTHSVMSVTTGQQFLVNYTPGIWLYLRATSRVLNHPYLFFLKSHFESIRHLFGGIFLLLGFLRTPLLTMFLNSFRVDVRKPSRSSISL